MAVTAPRARIEQAEGLRARPTRRDRLVSRARRYFAPAPPPPPYAICAGCRRTSCQATLYRPANQSVWQCARCLGDST